MVRKNDRKEGTDHTPSFTQLCPTGPFQAAPPRLPGDQEDAVANYSIGTLHLQHMKLQDRRHASHLMHAHKQMSKNSNGW